MSNAPTPPPAWRRAPALLVLVLSLAATAFGVWREIELQRRNLQLRFQENLAPVSNSFRDLFLQRFEVLHDQTRAALRRGNFTAEAWDDFARHSEWRQHFPGMREIGYAEFAGEQCVVKFVSTDGSPVVHAIGTDLNHDPLIREAAGKSADAGYGIPSRPVAFGDNNTNSVVIGFFTVQHRDSRPGTAAENRANLRGLVFYALDQGPYFEALAKDVHPGPFEIRLLRSGEPVVPKTPLQRTVTHAGMTGEWRMVFTMKPPAFSPAPWIVGGGGLFLSAVLFWLVATQARLRFAAEQAHEKVSAHEAAITELNRDLENKVAERTAQLNAALAEEKELSQLKSNFISMVSHEIRTPLALILSSSEILSRYLDRLPAEKRQQHLEQINDAVQRMSSLMEDVLLYSRAEAGRIEFNPRPVDLTALTRQLVDEILSATRHRCPIDMEFTGDLAAARGDEALLRHVLGNLLNNAIKYSAASAPVALRVGRDGGGAVFEIIDSGIGIPEADRTKLFEAFHRGANAKHIPGTGLGLVIVRRCVERHGGEFNIQSREGAGTTVTVRLPMFSPAHTEFVKKFS